MSEQKFITAEVEINKDECCDHHYVNFAEVSIGEHDCTIWFTHVGNRYPSEQFEGEKLRVDPCVRITTSHKLIPGLIYALSRELEKFKTLGGELSSKKP